MLRHVSKRSPWRIWVSQSSESLLCDEIIKTRQSAVRSWTYFMKHTVFLMWGAMLVSLYILWKYCYLSILRTISATSIVSWFRSALSDVMFVKKTRVCVAKKYMLISARSMFYWMFLVSASTHAWRGFTNVSRALQNIIPKFVYCRYRTSYGNFKLKLYTCAQSSKFQL